MNIEDQKALFNDLSCLLRVFNSQVHTNLRKTHKEVAKTNANNKLLHPQLQLKLDRYNYLLSTAYRVEKQLEKLKRRVATIATTATSNSMGLNTVIYDALEVLDEKDLPLDAWPDQLLNAVANAGYKICTSAD